MSNKILILSTLLLLAGCSGFRSCPCSHPEGTAKDEALKTNPIKEAPVVDRMGKNF